jgi:hypothetical protein
MDRLEQDRSLLVRQAVAMEGQILAVAVEELQAGEELETEMVVLEARELLLLDTRLELHNEKK